MAKCVFCGMDFEENIQEDVLEHQKIHQRKILAEEKFGHIAPYREREMLKTIAKCKETKLFNIGGERLNYYAHWCRSVEACNYDLKHPNFSEYVMLRQTNSDLLNGSYVNMKLYKEAIQLKSYLICTEPGLLVFQINEESNKEALLYSTVFVEKGTLLEILEDNNAVYNDGILQYEIKTLIPEYSTQLVYINPEKLEKCWSNNLFEAFNLTTQKKEYFKLEDFGKFTKINL